MEGLVRLLQTRNPPKPAKWTYIKMWEIMTGCSSHVLKVTAFISSSDLLSSRPRQTIKQFPGRNHDWKTRMPHQVMLLLAWSRSSHQRYPALFFFFFYIFWIRSHKSLYSYGLQKFQQLNRAAGEKEVQEKSSSGAAAINTQWNLKNVKVKQTQFWKDPGD